MAQSVERPATLNVVREIIAEVIGVQPDEVQADTVLMEELGVESIDFLDIIFKIEQVYTIEITRGALEAAARGDMTDEQYAPGGFISEEGLERLRLLMPEVKDKIVPGLRPVQVITLFTTQTFVNIADAKLAEASS
jgi:acyl carrier protein